MAAERCGARQTCGGSQSEKHGGEEEHNGKRRLTGVGGLQESRGEHKKKLLGLEERTLGGEEFLRITRETERRRHVFGVAVRKDLVEKGDGIHFGDEWIEL